VRIPVNGRGNQVLAHARLAHDQHVRLGTGTDANHALDALHGFRVANDRPMDVRLHLRPVARWFGMASCRWRWTRSSNGRSCPLDSGLATKSKAPNLTACTASGMVPLLLISTTTVDAWGRP